MEDARVFRCSECGGPNPEGSAECDFCRSPLQTLRCAHCFHLNPKDNEHCGGCGEVLGLIPVELPSELRCPECTVTLGAFDGDPGALYHCPTCAGQFIEHELLYNLIERRRRFADLRPAPAQNPARDTVRYLPCPACGDVMNRRNFGGTSGIIVDYCAAHGVWFQPGEFPKVLRFVASGGLADGRRARLGLPPPRTERQREAVAHAVAGAMAKEPHAELHRAQEEPGRTTALNVAASVAESTLDLLAILGNFLLDRD